MASALRDAVRAMFGQMLDLLGVFHGEIAELDQEIELQQSDPKWPSAPPESGIAGATMRPKNGRSSSVALIAKAAVR